MTTTTVSPTVSIRDLSEADLEAADRICRVAFGTFLGVPDPETFFGDADYVGTRFRANNTAALAAIIDDQLVGSNFVTSWGSLGFFGPLSVRVDLWDGGIASRLMEETMSVFAAWRTKHATLFTWADSAKHHGLYQKYGFYPTFLTAVMAKPVDARAEEADVVGAPADESAIDLCHEVSDGVYPGLDLSGEIRSVAEQGLGDTVIVPDDDARLAGFAVCHVGSGTEAGGGTCFVKFAAVRPGARAASDFDRLLSACERFAAGRGAERLVSGVNMGRLAAYRALIARGFRTQLTGVAMQQDGESGYNLPEAFVMDDWR